MYMNKKIGNGVSIDPPFKICALPVMYVVIWGVFLLFVEIHVLISLCIKCDAEEANFEANYTPESEIAVAKSQTPTYTVDTENMSQNPLVDNPYQ